MNHTWVFENYNDAWDVLRCMKARLNQDGFVTAEYFMNLIAHDSSRLGTGFDRYGWTDLSSVHIKQTKNCSLVQMVLPEPVALDIPAKVETPKNVNKSERVNHPNHYQSETGLEVIDVIEAFTFNLKGIEAWDTGSVLKYVCRWKEKNGVEDLKKAKWYLEDLIEHVEKLEAENA